MDSVNTEYGSDGLPTWAAKAQSVEQIFVDLKFNFQRSFYYGDPNDSGQYLSGNFNEALYRPNLRYFDELGVISEDVIGLESELISYYNDVLRTIQKRGKEVIGFLDYFGISPVVYAAHVNRKNLINFDLSERWSHSKRELASVMSTHDGMLYHDLDQGWRLEIFARRRKVWFRESGGELLELDWSILACDRDQLVRRTAEALQRTSKIISRLTEHFGVDLWDL